MRKLTLLILPALALAACAPAQGQKPRMYVGASADILAAITQIAGGIQPLGTHNYFGVVQATPTQVTLQSTPTIGAQLVGFGGPIVVTFTALQSGNTTTVTHFGKLGNDPIAPSSPINQRVENIYAELAKRFQQVQ